MVQMVVSFIPVMMFLIISQFAKCETTPPVPRQFPAGVGVDAIDLLFHYLPSAQGPVESPRNRSFAQQSMQSACAVNGFTTVRAAGGGFWPDDMAVWRSSPDRWWTAVSEAIHDAEQANCKLILTVFWNTFCFPDQVGEPLPMIANTSSKTWGLMKDYVSGLVSTVGTSPAVIAWEITNELNLLMDLNMQGRKASIAPSRGTPTQRTQADNISTTVGVEFGRNVAELLKSLDPLQRPVSGGYSMPRSSAFHLMNSFPSGKEDFRTDSESEFREMLGIIHAPFGLASAHLYASQGANGNVRFNATPVGPYNTDFLGVFAETIHNLGKVPLLAEFGDPLPGDRPWTSAVLQALGNASASSPAADLKPRYGSVKYTGITSALVWCWEFYQSSPTVAANFSIVPGRDNSIIALMRETNVRLMGS